MKRHRFTRFHRASAIELLSAVASTPGFTLNEASQHVNGDIDAPAVRLARAAWVASLGNGLTARESRANAECLLREGWKP